MSTASTAIGVGTDPSTSCAESFVMSCIPRSRMAGTPLVESAIVAPFKVSAPASTLMPSVSLSTAWTVYSYTRRPLESVLA